ncbi:type VI secretion system protein, membrane lipoprotein [Candidatus Bodocaedibacter vickermanii]|uniref:Type VI secretion system protein, membrane lipoprotein n=1 Tax=Candidatus Bodocaedibacter vickermanii TaxID=2741701 RepID=A0A7L9RUB6_9PROT|nr:type VI secretion system protein, membrane lipoprotein [Candidatus Paracaedibacteraceae bacterium 'Lake Konstanz']
MKQLMMRRWLQQIKTTWLIKGILSLSLLFISGCDKVNDLLSGEMIPPGLIALKQDIQLQRLLLVSEKEANKSRAFAFHVVLTKNIQMAQDLSQMTADQYFKADKSNVFAQNYHGMYKIFKFSVIPSKKMPELKLKIDPGSKYVGGYFFANLQQPKGNNRIRIPSGQHVMVKFSKDGMSLVTPDLMGEGLEALEEKIGIPGLPGM